MTPTSLDLTNGAQIGMGTAVAAGGIGSNYMVFWMAPAGLNPYDIRASRVSGDGTTVTSALVTAGGADIDPATACAADRCLLAFMAATRVNPMGYTPADIGYVIVDEALNAGTRFTITASTAQQAWTPQVAYDGTNWLILWRETYPGPVNQSTVRAMRIGPTGARLDATPFKVGTYTGMGTYTDTGNIAVSFDGAEFVAAWTTKQGTGGTTYSGTSVARISSAGVVLDPGGVALGGPSATAVTLAGPLLAYSRPVTGGPQVFARLISVPPRPDGGTDAASPTDGGYVDAASPRDGGHVDAASPKDGGHADAGADARAYVDAEGDVPRRPDAAVDASRMDASRDTHPAVDAAADHPRLSDAAADATRTDAGTHPNVDAATDHPQRSDAAVSTDAPADARGGATSSGCSCGVAAPPEPGGISLVLLTAVGLVLARRRRASLAPDRNLPTTRR